MKRKYKMGDSAVYYNFVCKPSELSQVDKETFFNEINKSLERNNLKKYKKEATKISNLKYGITVGDTYFIIE